MDYEPEREINGVTLILTRETHGRCVGCYYSKNDIPCNVSWCEIPFVGDGIFVEKEK